jgi:hypothetical protein
LQYSNSGGDSVAPTRAILIILTEFVKFMVYA